MQDKSVAVTEKRENSPSYNKRTSNLARLGLLIVAILWGSSLTVVKQASAVFQPNFILAIRFTIAFLILLVLFWKRVATANKKDIKNGVIIGLFLFIAYSSQTLGVTFTDPGRSAFLSASYCVIVPFLSWLFMSKRPDKFNVMAAVACVIGIYFVSAAGGAESSVFAQGMDAIIGDGLALLSGILFAAHIVAVVKFGQGRDSILMTICQFGTAATLSWLVTLLFENNTFANISTQSILELLYLAVFCTTIALLLQNVSQGYTDESSAALILSLESVFGILFPVMLGIESLTIYTLIGFAMIFIAIIISETKLSFLGLGGDTSESSN